MKTTAMKHQVAALAASDGKRNFAFFMEQGTGKTWVTLADIERCFLAGKIDAAVVVAPKGVHTNWVRREIPTHLSIEPEMYLWRGNPSSNVQKVKLENFFDKWIRVDKKPPLYILAINIDAINTKHGYAVIERFLTRHPKAMMVMDESTRIKNHQASRTKKAIKLSRMANARRILSGTPMPRAPLDLFSQFDFLKKGLLGTDSPRAFNSEFSVLLDQDDPEMMAIMRNLAGKTSIMPQIIKKDELGRPMFKNLDKLRALMAPHCFRVRKEDCLDLPPKVYKPIFFELSPKQRHVYDRLMDEYAYLFIDQDVEVAEDMSFAAIAARTKMKQVTSGFINIYGEPILMPSEDNPRMAAFTDLLDDLLETEDNPRFIVWAMFGEEIEHIVKVCEEKGLRVAAYEGATKAKRREEIIDEFQAGELDVFVGQAAAAGIGLTLTAANIAVYYSCSYDNELRLQSEDRCHRIGTTKTVTYYDLIGENTLDEDILRNLAHKVRVAEYVIDGKGSV